MRKAGVLSILFVVVLVAFAVIAEAQQPTKVPRIGFLFGSPPSAVSARIEQFRQGLRDLGYVEGKTIVVEYRYAEGKLDRLPALAAELVRLKVDLIVTGGPSATRPAKEATVTIPIVMAQDSDPVANGFVASLARPGGNITGFSTLSPELSGKRLELIPRLSRLAVLGTSTEPGNVQSLKETKLAAGALGVKLQYLDVLGPNDIESAFRAASKGRADAVLVLASAIFNAHRTQVVEHAVNSRPGDILALRFCGRRGAYDLRSRRALRRRPNNGRMNYV